MYIRYRIYKWISLVFKKLPFYFYLLYPAISTLYKSTLSFYKRKISLGFNSFISLIFIFDRYGILKNVTIIFYMNSVSFYAIYIFFSILYSVYFLELKAISPILKIIWVINNFQLNEKMEDNSIVLSEFEMRMYIHRVTVLRKIFTDWLSRQIEGEGASMCK